MVYGRKSENMGFQGIGNFLLFKLSGGYASIIYIPAYICIYIYDFVCNKYLIIKVKINKIAP